jgi:hypothetical protein
MGKTGTNRAEDLIPAHLCLDKKGKNGIDDLISASLPHTMPVIDSIDDMISATQCTEINATLPLQYDDAINLHLLDTVLMMAEGENITGKKQHKIISSNASTS